jgi:L-malate glycosyltransferase
MEHSRTILALHLDTGRGWRGGQQQAFYLHEGLCARGVDSLMVCPKGSPMAERCRERDLPVASFPIHGEWDLAAVVRIVRLARGRDFLVAHDAHALALGLFAAFLVPSIRLLAVRRVDFRIKIRGPGGLKYRSRRLARLVCISRAIRSLMAEQGVPESKLCVIHSAIDPDRFRDVIPSPDFRSAWNVPPDHAIVGTVAAFVGHKDYPNLVRAARIVLDQAPETIFFAVGSGPNFNAVRSLAVETGVEQAFRFTGQRNDVGVFLKSFDLFVIPSKMEGLGTSVLDAMAVGCPVVGTDAGGIPEMIDPGRDGLVVPRQNPEALAAAILQLLHDEPGRKELGRAARNKSLSFTRDRLVDRYLDLFRSLIKS